MSRIVPRFDFRIAFASRTDVGKVRKSNQDAVLVAPEIALFGVSDGMGGLSRGEEASQLALAEARKTMAKPEAAKLLERYVVDPRLGNRRAVFDLLRQACRAANAAVFASSASRTQDDPNDEIRRMGATLDLVLLTRDRAFFAHVGDGRAYLVRSKATLQLTQDHALYESLRASGELKTPRKPARNPLINAIGLAEDVQVDTVFVDLGRGDRIVLSTDGIHGALDEAEITRLCQRGTPEEIASSLVGAANDRGGRDNATAIVIHVAERFLSRAADHSPMATDLAAISRSPLVQDLPPGSVLEMLAAGVEVEAQPGDRLPQLIASDSCAYIVVEGTIQLADGRTLGPSALLFPECLVGTQRDEPLPEVTSPARLIRIRHDDFREVCEHSDALAARLYLRLARHLAMYR